MPQLFYLDTVQSEKGSLTVFENVFSQEIKRVFFIYDAEGKQRGGHRHHLAQVALVCLSGSCKVYVHDGKREYTYWLNHPQKCLLLAPEDWHDMSDFSGGSVLLVASDRLYDEADYIYEPYTRKAACLFAPAC
ncbi:sugar 3,4-ketoisomerase [Arsenicibacter rosenii]|uniref:Sugar 3,4-ketoisomerase QdtA cupin domain-containing protein n=1 Tax=Arsenicibacter rosenii TaxID=1750698 RepID=A0A1S2VFS9_9BACT|nr:FdtA/QdtA family cupin domain-containing protein [Arsenicibacter rosenii]OIN57564.1 hypothetical protein BLX24_18945 [Arsenicibacter rosenii]